MRATVKRIWDSLPIHLTNNNQFLLVFPLPSVFTSSPTTKKKRPPTWSVLFTSVATALEQIRVRSILQRCYDPYWLTNLFFPFIMQVSNIFFAFLIAFRLVDWMVRFHLYCCFSFVSVGWMSNSLRKNGEFCRLIKTWLTLTDQKEFDLLCTGDWFPTFDLINDGSVTWWVSSKKRRDAYHLVILHVMTNFHFKDSLLWPCTKQKKERERNSLVSCWCPVACTFFTGWLEVAFPLLTVA